MGVGLNHLSFSCIPRFAFTQTIRARPRPLPFYFKSATHAVSTPTDLPYLKTL